MFRVLVVSCTLRRVGLRRLIAALPFAFGASLLRALPLLRITRGSHQFSFLRVQVLE